MIKTEEQLIKEAKERYPSGTTVKFLSTSYVDEGTIDWEKTLNHPTYVFNGGNLYIGTLETNGNNRGILYDGKKWAEIISKIEVPKFKVGDKVIGNSKANGKYSVTTVGWKGEITEVGKSNIRVKGPGLNFDVSVDIDCFDLIPPEKESILEYVECIKGNIPPIVIGKIFKVKNYNPQKGEINLEEHKSIIFNIFFGEKSRVKDNMSDFKPSTKEAYEAQNKPKSPEFIVGKWYKAHNDFYIKFSKKVDHRIYGNTISSSHIYREEDYWSNSDMEKSALENGPIDVSEIQQYLPEGHPDKIKIPMKSLYWKNTENSRVYINKYEGEVEANNRGQLVGYLTGHPDIEKYTARGGTATTDGTFTIPSKEEIDHLEACIKARKFIPKEEALNPKKMEDLTGRWIKALIDYPNAGAVKKGEYGLVIKKEGYADFPSQNNYGFSMYDWGRLYELMPIGFIPPSEPKKFLFNEGDLVVSDHPYPTWWQKGEILKLGGQYWSGKDRYAIDRGDTIAAISKSCPQGNGNLDQHGKNALRHCTAEEIAYYNKVGIGANINDMKKEDEVFNHDKLVEQAISRFEPGDKFKDLVNNVECTIIKGPSWTSYPATKALYVSSTGNSANKTNCIYKDGKWAERITVQYIPEMKNEISIEEAKRRYPVGTMFNSKGGNINVIVTKDTEFYLEDGVPKGRNLDKKSANGFISNGHFAVFFNYGQWAEIVSKPVFDTERIEAQINRITYGGPIRPEYREGILLSLEEDEELIDSSVNRITSIKTNLVEVN